MRNPADHPFLALWGALMMPIVAASLAIFGVAFKAAAYILKAIFGGYR
jgi:hypothetical protein